MVAKRKVREDFNPETKYSVDVSMCSDEVKKVVQQAFFDVGFSWRKGGKQYLYLDKVKYTNTSNSGIVTEYCMFGSTTGDCNMSAKEFLDLVYEPEKQGHVHAELMAQYAEDAKTHSRPWELWQIHYTGDVWHELGGNPTWCNNKNYRRKPKTHIVNGVEIPDLRVSPKYGECFFLASPLSSELAPHSKFLGHDIDKLWVDRGLTYQHTEEGRKAAILHTKAMLGIIAS